MQLDLREGVSDFGMVEDTSTLSAEYQVGSYVVRGSSVNSIRGLKGTDDGVVHIWVAEYVAAGHYDDRSKEDGSGNVPHLEEILGGNSILSRPTSVPKTDIEPPRFLGRS